MIEVVLYNTSNYCWLESEDNGPNALRLETDPFVGLLRTTRARRFAEQEGLRVVRVENVGRVRRATKEAITPQIHVEEQVEKDRAALIQYLETDGTWVERVWLPVIRWVDRIARRQKFKKIRTDEILLTKPVEVPVRTMVGEDFEDASITIREETLLIDFDSGRESIMVPLDAITRK